MSQLVTCKLSKFTVQCNTDINYGNKTQQLKTVCKSNVSNKTHNILHDARAVTKCSMIRVFDGFNFHWNVTMLLLNDATCRVSHDMCQLTTQISIKHVERQYKQADISHTADYVSCQLGATTYNNTLNTWHVIYNTVTCEPDI